MTIGMVETSFITYAGLVLFIITLLALMGIIYSVNVRQYRYSIIFGMVCLVGIFYIAGFEATIYEMDIKQEIWRWTDIYEVIPVEVVLSSGGVCLMVLAMAWISLRKRTSTMLTPRSLEEGLAMLPDGVYFEGQDGTPLLINRRMQKIINELLERPVYGRRLMDTLLVGGVAECDSISEKNDENPMSDMISGKHADFENVRPGCRVWKSDAGTLVGLADGTVWDIRYRDIPVKRGRKAEMVHELLAYDITKRYEKSVELEKRNEHLNAVNEGLREYSSNLDSIIRQKEMLNAKIRLHDDVGRSLLALKAYLAYDDSESGAAGDYGINNDTDYNKNGTTNLRHDRRHLEEFWKSTIAVLNNEAEREPDVDRMGVIKKAAEAVNVRLVINGELRADDRSSGVEELLAAAIHECLTNTVKHADGDRLNVDIEYSEEELVIRLTNNGRPPEGEISETGGLMNLRKMVEMKGGEMIIESEPGFVLTICRSI